MSEELGSVEVVETPADYRSVKALRHDDGYLEWITDELCLVRDGDYTICNRSRGHEGYHRETLADGTLWGEWRSVTPRSERNRAERYVAPGERESEEKRDELRDSADG